MISFSSLSVRERLKDNSKLDKLSKLLNWDAINKHLTKLHKSDYHNKGGRISYNKLSMFKLILLGQWNSLSDPELEYALRIRLDFISFCGFDINDAVPDETTICRYRNKLIEHDLIELLLSEVNSQLDDLNLKVKKTDMAIVDATIIESNAKPHNKTICEIAVDREESSSESNDKKDPKDINSDSNYEVTISADKDAAWLKKGNKSYFGYKSFATTDEEGYILNSYTTPANEAEVNKLDRMSDNITAIRFSGDKAYDSKKNRALLKKKKIKSGIMFKAKKNKALTRWQKKFNKLISKKRFRVEQTFGTLKRIFGFSRASYFTTKKVQAQFTMKAICLNLLKAINKVKFIIPRLAATG